MKKLLLSLFLGVAFGLGPINDYAQSETTIRQGGAIYDVSTGSFLGQVNINTGREETLASTIGSGLTATSVVCVNASKVLTSTCTSAAPSFGATAVTTLTGTSTFNVTGTGPHAIGGATNAGIQFLQTGTFVDSGGTAQGFLLNTTFNPAVGQTVYGSQITPTINRAASGTHVDFTSLTLAPPTIGGGGAAITNSSTLKVTGAPSIGSNLYSIWVVAGLTQLDGTTNIKGSATNDSAAAGYVGELLTVTVASGSAVSLTTATSANIATLSVTAGDWDCAAQVTHNAAATTSVTLLQIGISATTATLPTQAGGSGIGTDPLAIFRQAAAVPGGALTTNVGPVRVSLSGTTNIFLVANDTFTVSTMSGYGTLRCRRAR